MKYMTKVGDDEDRDRTKEGHEVWLCDGTSIAVSATRPACLTRAE